MKAVICSVIHKLGTFSRQSATSRTIFTAGLNGVRPEHEGYATDNGGKIYLSDVMQNIKENTEISRDHLTPEIALHLITPNCKLWTALDGDIIFPDPFWAFYWPGGQVLTRFLLDNPDLLRDKNVLDVGSGCGASAIASAISGARHIVANDICSVAGEAIRLNAELNRVHLHIDQRNLLGTVAEKWDVILLGDMFYDEVFTKVVADWLEILQRDFKKLILIGDPGRAAFVRHPISTKLKRVAKCELHPQCKMENNGLTYGYVWQYSS